MHSHVFAEMCVIKIHTSCAPQALRTIAKGKDI